MLQVSRGIISASYHLCGRENHRKGFATMTGLTSSTGHSPASAYRSASDYDRQLTENDMRANAWHYFGYPTLSAYMSSSNDFFLLRRFSRASAHCLLYQQHEIAKRGKDLDAWDELARGCKPDGSGASDSFEKDPIKERTEIIKELIPLLREYRMVQLPCGSEMCLRSA